MSDASPERDTRFQYEIIKDVSASIRRLADSMSEMQRTQVTMLERLAALEANKVSESVAALAVELKTLDDRVDTLFRDKDRRDGAIGLIGGIRSWWPALIGIASLFSALWLAGRSAGLIPAPPATLPPPVAIERRAATPTEGP